MALDGADTNSSSNVFESGNYVPPAWVIKVPPWATPITQIS
jgi:hypothetical protein